MNKEISTQQNIKVQNWRKLENTEKKEFQTIVKILNRYTRLNSSKKPSESFLYREALTGLEIEKFEVLIKQLGKYEFLIQVNSNHLGDEGWIHIDGIQQEEDELKAKGIKESPVFEVICLTDLFAKAVEVDEKSIRIN